jgi:hypothetical protein
MLSSRGDIRALFDELAAVSVTEVEKPWGGEFILQINQLVIKLIEVHDGHRTSKQLHEHKDEILYVLRGTGRLEGSADELKHYPSRPSPGYRVLPRAVHQAVGPLLMLELSTNDLDDVVRLHDPYKRAAT